MGLMSALSGNAGEIQAEQAQQDLQNLLVDDERIERAYQVGRDVFAFTQFRLLLVDKQGLTGTKVEYRSIPYRSITNFSVETAGNFDLDAELKIWVTGSPLAISKEFNKKVNVYEVQSVLARHVMAR
jgi:hypothetical protein